MRHITWEIIKKNKILCGTTFLLSILGGVVSPIMVVYEQKLIDLVNQLWGSSGLLSATFIPLLAILLLNICIHFFPVISDLFQSKLQIRTDNFYSQKLIDKLNIIEYKCLEDTETLNLYYRISSQIGNKPSELIKCQYGFLTAIISVVGFFLIILNASFLCAAIYAILFVLLLVFANQAAKRFYQLNQHFSETERRVVYLDSVVNTKKYAHEKKLFGFTDYIDEKRSSFLLNQRDEMKKYDFKYGLLFSMIDTAGYICAIALMVAMLSGVSDGAISVGLFISATHAAINLNLVTQNKVRTLFNELMNQKIFWKEYCNFMNLRNETSHQALNKKATLDFVPFDSLEFRDVSFRYGQGELILDKVSFKIEKGKQYALVGKNGSGKSTIIKLILRLYAVEQGEILLNGININEYDIKELYKYFATVFQDFNKYYLSVEDNVVLNRERLPKKVMKVLDTVGLKALIQGMPHGLDTNLGEIHENGVNISGGEWQKLAFARALYQDSAILLLDEPTSALDPIAENDLYQQFGAISKNKSSLFITHRLASTQMADIIYVLDGGRIVESGSHKSLMDYQGLYYRMYESQRKWYNEGIEHDET